MIGFLPPLYEDELICSWHARYIVYSGYTSVSDAYIDIYGNKTIRPSVELVNSLSAEAIDAVSRYKPLRRLILEHTMFPEYGRFIDPVRREKLLSECDLTRGNWINTLMIPVSNNDRYLKYCPECVKEDRERYGETYWHRSHQISNIKICKKHRIYLEDSSVIIDRNNTRLKAAETVITLTGFMKKCDNPIILSFADYLSAVFYSSRYSHDKIGKYLSTRIDRSYIHDNGDRRLYALYDAYRAYFSSLDDNELMMIDYMSKLLRGRRGSSYHICQLGMFLGIDVEALLNSEAESDEKRTFRIVAENLGEPIENVERIGSAVLKEYGKRSGKNIRSLWQKKRIEDEDARLLQKVRDICTEMYGYGDKRPGKVSLSSISRYLKIDFHRLKKMRSCMEEINRYYETQEQYWAREIIWAVRQIRMNREPLNYKHIRNYTSLRKDNILDSLNALKEQSEEVYKMMREIV